MFKIGSLSVAAAVLAGSFRRASEGGTKPNFYFRKGFAWNKLVESLKIISIVTREGAYRS